MSTYSTSDGSVAATTAGGVDSKLMRRVVLGGAVGSFVEWYEFAVYGFLAATLAKAFFPAVGGGNGVLASLAVFGVAFFARPVGGFLWGYVGDRIGRRQTLAITVLSMSLCTTLVGVLPSAATIGVAAPILLVALRILQGVAAGGEISGAVSFIAEHSDAGRRGWRVATVEAGAVSGNLVGALVTSIMILSLPAASLTSWGWRIPFLIAIVMGLVGVYIRRRLEETPYFRELEERGDRAGNPLYEALTGRAQWVLLARSFGVVALNAASFFLIVGYLPTFANSILKLSGWAAVTPPVIALIVTLAAVYLGGWLSDLSRRKTLLLSAGGLAVLSYPCFLLITSGHYGLIVLGLVIFGVPTGVYCSATQVALTDMFPTKVRVSGHGVAYNISVAIFGGIAPYLITSLNHATGDRLVAAYFVAAVAVLSFLVSLTVTETAGKPLRRD
ncbi:MAG TPA: MFS transporter [Amycolatopsis sp.]|nr:MFS transporter [Amycolatopsis sp.]